MSEFINDICKGCGGVLKHDQTTGKYICNYCGREFVRNQDNTLQQITKQDLEEQRTKIVDDVKAVFSETIEKSKTIYGENQDKLIEVIEERKQKTEKKEKIKARTKRVWIILLITALASMFACGTILICEGLFLNMPPSNYFPFFMSGGIFLLTLFVVPILIWTIIRGKHGKSIKMLVVSLIMGTIMTITSFVALPIKNSYYIMQEQYKNSTLTTYTVDSKIKGIDNRAFENSKELEEIVFEKNSKLKNIYDEAFANCTSLKSITLPSSLTYMGYSVFYNCTSLTDIIIPNSLKSIGSSCFDKCVSLKNIYFYGTSTEWENLLALSGSNIEPSIYYYSETQPSTVGNFWHYVNYVPTIWT